MPEDAGLDLDFDAGDDLGALGDPDAELADLSDARDMARDEAEDNARRQAEAYARERAAADADQADQDLADIQGAVTGTVTGTGPVAGKALPGRTVELLGKRFRVAQKVGLMPLLKFSAYADMDTQDSRALGAMYSMLKDCIDPADWRAFEDHAVDSKAEADDLLDVITKAVELIAGRPTEQRAPSSPGQRAISGGSTAGSSSRRAKGSRR